MHAHYSMHPLPPHTHTLRDVTVIRLVGKDTVEEDMLVCAQSKLKLEQDLTASSDSGEGLETKYM